MHPANEAAGQRVATGGIGVADSAHSGTGMPARNENWSSASNWPDASRLLARAVFQATATANAGPIR
jgi:hypothetical protein